MTDPTPAPQAQDSTQPPLASPLSQIGAGTVISALLGVLGAAAGAGWPGVVALLLVGLAVPFGYSAIVDMLNKKIDDRDLDRAGADAGKTAVSLQNQGRDVTSGLDELEKSNPPGASPR